MTEVKVFVALIPLFIFWGMAIHAMWRTELFRWYFIASAIAAFVMWHEYSFFHIAVGFVALTVAIPMALMIPYLFWTRLIHGHQNVIPPSGED